MANITIRPATDADCIALGATMRKEDRAEVASSSGMPPVAALRDCLAKSSHANTALVDGRVICMFGVAPHPEEWGSGFVWVLGSDLVVEHRRIFARLSRKYLASMLAIYPRLMNAVDARYTASVRWIEWLGFDLSEPVPIGKDGALFRVFEKRA